MRRGSKRPDRHERLLECHRAELESLKLEYPKEPIVLVGKSMGSRIGCHLSLEEDVEAVVCLGFPLISASGKSREDVLLQMRTRVLFVQGTRDRMGPLDTFTDVMARMRVPASLHVVNTGNHSLELTKTHTKKTGETQEDADRLALGVIGKFLAC
jgi:uncharacterized protein